MSEIKKGSRVVCVDAGGYRSVVDGCEYVVSEVTNNGFYIKVEGANQSFYASRFKLVEEAKPAVAVRDHNQVRADRRKELLDGVVAYHTAGKAVPDEWLSELSRGWMGM